MGNFNLIFGTIFAAVGIILSVIGYVRIEDNRAFFTTAIEARGEVISVHWSETFYKGRVSYPVVMYFTDDGESHILRIKIGSTTPTHNLGERVAVFYDPGDVENARLDSFYYLWGIAILFSVMGALFCLAGAAFLLFGLKGVLILFWIRQWGRPVVGEVVEVIHNTRVIYSGCSPYIIVAEWKDPETEIVHSFSSPNHWSNPSGLPRKGDPVEIRISGREELYSWINLEKRFVTARPQ